MLIINALGTPAPQGSKGAVIRGKRAYVIDTNTRTQPWRKIVHDAATERIAAVGHQAFTGDVALHLIFYMPRPKSHYRTGRHAHQLRPDAPTWCGKTPDVDKLTRAVMDSLTTAGVYTDDAQVVILHVEDRYANAAAGVQIQVAPIDEGGDETPPAGP